MILALALLAQCPDISVVSPTGNLHDDLGASIALDGDVLVAGNPRRKIGSYDGDSAVVFRRTAAGWVHEAELFASNKHQGQDFGFSVSVAGERILVGDPGAPGAAYFTGAAYLFEHQAGQWVEVQKLFAAGGAFEDQFGYSVALSEDGTRAVVGAPNFSVPGHAVVFEDQGGAFVQTAVIPMPGPSSSVAMGWNFGSAVAVQGDRIVVADPLATSSAWFGPTGVGYVFDLVGAGWANTAKLEPGMGGAGGTSVAMSGDVVVLGAPGTSGLYPTVADVGFPCVFRDTAEGWLQEAVYSSVGTEADGHLGWSVDVQGDWLAAGEPKHAGNEGRVRLYRWDGTTWLHEHTLDPSTPHLQLGRAVALSGARVVAGAPQADTGIGSNWTPFSTSTGPGEVRVWPLPVGAELWGEVTEASLAGGGIQALQLTTCPPRANDTHLLLGSLSGTSPGIPVDGLMLPLAFDSYTAWLLSNPNPAHLPGSFGALDAGGAASTTMTVPAGSPPAWVGAVFQHAFAVITTSGGGLSVVQVSQPVSLELTP